MKIPESAYQAATDAIFEDDPRITEGDAYGLASNALQAALPHLEAALRTQIAADLQERLVPADQTEVAVWIRNQAARIAEEGPLK